MKGCLRGCLVRLAILAVLASIGWGVLWYFVIRVE
ncbi:hypothetical protein ES708_20145 [subsurface metagenome]